LGAAEALREQIHLVRMQFETAEYDALVSVLGGQVNASTFEKAWHNGRAMKTEQAIELALN
jgi:hypothetical protein